MLPSASLVALLAGALALPSFARDESALQGRAELALSSSAFQALYSVDGDQLDLPTSQVSGGFFMSEAQDIVLSGGILYPAGLHMGRLSMRVGPRAFGALLDEENDDVWALTVGTEIRFDLDRGRNVSLVGRAFYSPEILTFGSAESLTDFSAHAELRVARRVSVFAGMRWLELALNGGTGDKTLQDEFFVGASWRLE